MLTFSKADNLHSHMDHEIENQLSLKTKTNCCFGQLTKQVREKTIQK
jgi:hypothetical protein